YPAACGTPPARRRSSRSLRRTGRQRPAGPAWPRTGVPGRSSGPGPSVPGSGTPGCPPGRRRRRTAWRWSP
ncbi:Helix-turn-helix domain, partial [Dysosmobacter welbionis]